MHADLDKIKWLLENKTAYNIGKITGIPNQVIQRLNTGERDVESIKFSTAIKLTQYAEKELNKIKMENEIMDKKLKEAEMILEDIKNPETKCEYFFIKDGSFIANEDTGNLWSAFGFFAEHEYMYGVYGDRLSVYGQVDNTTTSDENILKYIIKALEISECKKYESRNQLPKGIKTVSSSFVGL